MQATITTPFQRYTIGLPHNRSSIGEASFSVRNVLNDFLVSPEHEFCELVVGNELGPVATTAQVMGFINSMFLVPNLAGIVLSAYDEVWVPNWEQQIRHHLRDAYLFVFRLVSITAPLEIVYRYYDFPGRPHSVSSVAKIPVDCVDYASVGRILNNTRDGIQALHLLPPLTPLRDPVGSYQRQLVQALLRNGNFEKIIIPFALLDDAERVFTAMQGSTRLRSLEVGAPITESDFSLASDFRMLINTTKGIEGLVHLRKLIVPYNLENFDLLQELLLRMFYEHNARNNLSTFSRS